MDQRKQTRVASLTALAKDEPRTIFGAVTAQPPTPTFWMHQLREESGADQRTSLNPAVFEGKVAELLRPTKGGA